MQYTALRRQVKVAVHLRATVMCVRWESVPDTAFVKLREAHYQLAAPDAIEMDVLVDRSVIGFLL